MPVNTDFNLVLMQSSLSVLFIGVFIIIFLVMFLCKLQYGRVHKYLLNSSVNTGNKIACEFLICTKLWYMYYRGLVYVSNCGRSWHVAVPVFCNVCSISVVFTLSLLKQQPVKLSMYLWRGAVDRWLALLNLESRLPVGGSSCQPGRWVLDLSGKVTNYQRWELAFDLTWLSLARLTQFSDPVTKRFTFYHVLKQSFHRTLARLVLLFDAVINLLFWLYIILQSKFLKTVFFACNSCDSFEWSEVAKVQTCIFWRQEIDEMSQLKEIQKS